MKMSKSKQYPDKLAERLIIGTANFRQHRNCSPASGHSSVNSTEGDQKGHT